MSSSRRASTLSEGARLAGGLIVQPLLAAGLAFVLFPVLMLDPDGRTLAGGYVSNPTAAAISVALGAGVVAAVVTVLGVWPTAVWLMKRRSLTFARTLLFGLGFGILPYVLGVAAVGRTYGSSGVLRGLLFSAVLGVAGAAAFWFIALLPSRVQRGVSIG